MAQCVCAYSDGRDSWKNGIGNFIIRIRGIIATISLSVLFLTSAPFWVPTLEFLNKNYPIKIYFYISTILLCSSLIVSFIYLRRITMRSLRVKHVLHQFAHDIRDNQNLFFKDALKKTFVKFRDKYQTHLDEIVFHSCEYFRTIIGDESIEAVIRLAEPVCGEEGNVTYKTFARTKGLNKNRNNTTESIKANEGLPKYLLDKKCQNILIYNNIKEAIELGLFKKTKSEESFPDEIATMMVAPINAWDGKKQSMIGILYITSKSEKAFSEKHTDNLRFVADTISSSIAFMTEIYKIHKKLTKGVK